MMWLFVTLLASQAFANGEQTFCNQQSTMMMVMGNGILTECMGMNQCTMMNAAMQRAFQQMAGIPGDQIVVDTDKILKDCVLKVADCIGEFPSTFDMDCWDPTFEDHKLSDLHAMSTKLKQCQSANFAAFLNCMAGDNTNGVGCVCEICDNEDGDFDLVC